MRVAWVIGIALVGCYSPSPAPGSPCNSLGECPAGLECRNNLCELPGGSDGGTDASFDATSDAMVDACAEAMCLGHEIIGCGAPIACAHGCASPPAHCVVLKPSNGVTSALLDGATANVNGDDWTFDTESGRIRAPGNVILRDAGVGLVSGIRFEIIDGAGVFAATSFTLGSGQRWDVDGVNPLVLYAASTISIDGILHGAATLGSAGPGGTSGTTSTSPSSQCRGRAGRLLAMQHAEGGGGGGGATAGGNGGASNDASPTGFGGPECTSRSTTIPLRGGAGGGAGGASALNAGGGGGGAIMLVAMDAITILEDGVVSASGGGGISGSGAVPGSGEGGGGGGAGGAVLLEAPTVMIAGALTANGGSGASPFNIDGNDGELDDDNAADGGRFAGPGGVAHGGDGGARVGPGNGESYIYDDGLGTATSQTHRGAGGGGAAGRIQIRASERTLTNAVISPNPVLASPTYE